MSMKFYTVKQVAEALHLTPRHIYRLISDGMLGCHKIGSAVRIEQSQLDAWLSSKRKYTKYEAEAMASR